MVARASEPDESGRLDANLVAMCDVVETSGCCEAILSIFLEAKKRQGYIN